MLYKYLIPMDWTIMASLSNVKMKVFHQHFALINVQFAMRGHNNKSLEAIIWSPTFFFHHYTKMQRKYQTQIEHATNPCITLPLSILFNLMKKPWSIEKVFLGHAFPFVWNSLIEWQGNIYILSLSCIRFFNSRNKLSK